MPFKKGALYRIFRGLISGEQNRIRSDNLRLTQYFRVVAEALPLEIPLLPKELVYIYLDILSVSLYMPSYDSSGTRYVTTNLSVLYVRRSKFPLWCESCVFAAEPCTADIGDVV
ncbi:hypothetical protein PoB_001619800 [Plakobranchus ocellatus]|uniref:Uncharacterized protein n=1 Tax=Plakobranchus ocellatus TaxID=259542 RepID=A0AAV3Z5G3_9GAST|nr:hypothetical protein PoB_001619800 [Plakobranchus ocellatus]